LYDDSVPPLKCLPGDDQTAAAVSSRARARADDVLAAASSKIDREAAAASRRTGRYQFTEQGVGSQPFAVSGSFLKCELVMKGAVRYSGSSTMVVTIR
jgi:hypothetical protein